MPGGGPAAASVLVGPRSVVIEFPRRRNRLEKFGVLSPGHGVYANFPWAKPSVAFAHVANRWHSQGLPWSAVATSCGVGCNAVPHDVSSSIRWRNDGISFET
jgi:hypothetical protein